MAVRTLARALRRVLTKVTVWHLLLVLAVLAIALAATRREGLGQRDACYEQCSAANSAQRGGCEQQCDDAFGSGGGGSGGGKRKKPKRKKPKRTKKPKVDASGDAGSGDAGGGGDGADAGSGGGGKTWMTWHTYDTQGNGDGAGIGQTACADKLGPKAGSLKGKVWVAINQGEFGFGGSWESFQKACGKCLRVTNGGKSVTAVVVDIKGAEGIDISANGYRKLGGKNARVTATLGGSCA